MNIHNTCRRCAGCGHVCENHPRRPWAEMSDHDQACGCGAGMPCPECCESVPQDGKHSILEAFQRRESMNDHQETDSFAVGKSELTAGLERGLAMEILFAARADHCIRLAQAKNAWDEAGLSYATPIARAVRELRAAWYHDGKAEQVERCRKAISDLESVLRSDTN